MRKNPVGSDKRDLRFARVPFLHFGSGGCSVCASSIAQEIMIRLIVDERYIDEFTCSPWDIENLVYGRLYCNGTVGEFDEIRDVSINADTGLVKVTTLRKASTALKSSVKTPSTLSFVTREWVLENMERFESDSSLFHLTGGVHSAALVDEAGLHVRFEDIGRHNALDKLAGWCFKNHIDANDKVILFSGRVPREIIVKVAKIGACAIVSPGAPTNFTIEYASEHQITVIGFAKQGGFNVYAHPERIIDECYSVCHSERIA